MGAGSDVASRCGITPCTATLRDEHARAVDPASPPHPRLGERGFAIVESEAAGAPAALVSPDSATCERCLAELFDPADRRFRYPFINCTDCGPRFTIVRGVPYDRPLTTMAGFAMCTPCRAEYDDPADRRFHAQPNACPRCGPAARLVDAAGVEVPADGAADAVAAAARALAAGAIVAIKGLGGYHLSCRAGDRGAVSRLRGRKHRYDKPFAVMVPDLAAARRIVQLDGAEERLLAGRERPILLARRRADAAVADAVAPRHRDLGVMLPYSPLHHLLLSDLAALDRVGGVAPVLVMTSGNVSDEPIAYRDDEALGRLAGIADLFLVHDRPIHTRTDDSVVRVVTVGGARRTLTLRRSRGFVPAPLPLPVPAPAPLLACGAEQKSTFCLASGERAWVGHHIGDLENFETLRSFREGVEHFERLFATRPALVAHDLHPEYLSTKYALERSELEPVGVQHHHAHMAACLAEHGRSDPAIGVIYDGTGWGPDGTVWGGELLPGDLRGFARIGHLRAALRRRGRALRRARPSRLRGAGGDRAGADRGPGRDRIVPASARGERCADRAGPAAARARGPARPGGRRGRGRGALPQHARGGDAARLYGGGAAERRTPGRALGRRVPERTASRAAGPGARAIRPESARAGAIPAERRRDLLRPGGDPGRALDHPVAAAAAPACSAPVSILRPDSGPIPLQTRR